MTGDRRRTAWRIRTAAAALAVAVTATGGRAACLEVLARWGWGPTRAVAAADGNVYAGMGSVFVVVGGLPASKPVIRGSVTLPDVVVAISVSGPLAAVACGQAGVHFVDVADPVHPVIAGSVNTWGSARDVVLAGNVAWLADDWRDLLAIDVSNPSDPHPIGRYDIPGPGLGVDVANGRAVVACDYNGLVMLDVADPSRPALLGAFDPPGNVVIADVLLRQTTVFTIEVSGVYRDKAAVVAYDVADPAAIVERGRTPIDPPWSTGRLALSGDVLLALSGAAVAVIDARNPAALSRWQVWNGPQTDFGEGGACNVAAAGGVMYVANGVGGVAGARVLSGTNLQTLPSLPARGPTTRARVAGAHAILASAGAGFTFLSLADLAEVGSYDEDVDSGADAAVRGTTAYLLDGRWGLHTVDVSAIAKPQKKDVLQLSNCFDIADAGRYLYLGGSFGIDAVDLADPAKPARAGSLKTPGFGGTVLKGTPEDVAMAGAHLVVAAGNAGLQVLDVSTPSAITATGLHGLGSAARGIAVAGRRGVAATASGVALVDLGAPAAPIGAGTLPPAVTGVAAAGDLALTTGDGVVAVVDLGGSTGPVEIVARRLGGARANATIDGTRAFVPLDDAGLAVVDLAGCPPAPCAYTASARALPSAGAPPLAVQFRGELISECPAWPEFEWIFGDGSANEYIPEPVHVYRAAGTFAWTMAVSANGRTSHVARGTVSVGSGPEIAVLDGAAALTDGQARPVDMGVGKLGSVPLTRTFTVRNDGDRTLTVGAPSVPAGFAVAEPLAGSLAAGQADTFTLRLSASAPGAYSGTVSIPSSDADESPFTFPVSAALRPVKRVRRAL